jgi:CBS domain-containing protein
LGIARAAVAAKRWIARKFFLGCRDRPLPSAVNRAVSFHLNLQTDRVTAAYPEQALLVCPEETVGAVLQLMRMHKSGSVLVMGPSREGEPEVLQGIFTERDALRCLANGAPLAAPIREAMSAPPHCVTRDATVGETIEQMSRRGHRHLPILDESGLPCGVAGVRGIVQFLVDHFPQTIYTLPPEPGRTPAHREGA